MIATVIERLEVCNCFLENIDNIFIRKISVKLNCKEETLLCASNIINLMIPLSSIAYYTPSFKSTILVFKHIITIVVIHCSLFVVRCKQLWNIFYTKDYPSQWVVLRTAIFRNCYWSDYNLRDYHQRNGQ